MVMPNHGHTLITRFEGYELRDIFHSLKSYTAPKATRCFTPRNNFGWKIILIDTFETQAFSRDRSIERNTLKAWLREF